MRYFDADEAKSLNAEQWQLDLLAVNPDYCSWGPHEDYMWTKGDGWNSPVTVPNWSAFGWKLDDLNECANFYFSVVRASEECETCGGNGYHSDAQQVVRTFYRHSCEPGEDHWNDKITDDEAAALVEHGRGSVNGLTTAEDFNRANAPGARGLGHDAINRHILIEARLKRLAIKATCEACDGTGYTFTAPNAHVELTLWWLHPRKGCSRGVEISDIRREDLPAVRALLAQAAERNAERFSRIGLITPEASAERDGL